jgi:hypothetical protein
MVANLDKLEGGGTCIQEVKEIVEKEVGLEETCKDENAELCRSLHTLIHFCVNEALLCRERLNKRARIEETFSFTFHPETKCSCCGDQPIMGWRYHALQRMRR